MTAKATIQDFDSQWDLPRTPLKSAYKGLSENYTETMTLVNEYLGVTDVDIPPPSIKRQASEAKLKLIEQFTNDCKQNVKQVRMALRKSNHKHR